MRNLKPYKTKATAMMGGRILLDKLQKRIDDSPSKFCKNYGQSEILDFEDRLCDLHYTEKCDVMDMMYCVSSMTPNK